MYVCGVTAYDLSHIGHACVYVSLDVLFRYLKHLEYEAYYVRNATDVDDKIIARANELGEDPLSLSRRYFDEFRCDMSYLYCISPSVEPRVSDHMPQIIDMIKQTNFLNMDNYLDGSWKIIEQSTKEGEPFWESPWGPGRPGWHIECSATSTAYLGYSFDIHGGGVDLVFPHHENEIAQSCDACNKSNISYWIHNGFVNIDNEKMSKSLGNFFTIWQVIDLYHPLAVRLFLMGTHYRSPINYSNAQLESASDRVFYIYQTLRDCEEVLSQHHEADCKDNIPPATQTCIDKFHNDFEISMLDDLHTSVVLAAMSDPLKTINDLLHTRRKQELRIQSLSALEEEIKSVLSVLGLMPTSYAEVLQQLREKALKRAGLQEDEVSQKIEQRTSVRKK